mmetsp:Transcript_20499/g.55953  ORF Transcript_20499/g.55953 Transcript_20499/m.55953 type:complete len:321 (-) Transcript_20499:7-969(-)
MVELLTLPQRWVLRAVRAGTGNKLGLAVHPVLVDGDLVGWGRLQLRTAHVALLVRHWRPGLRSHVGTPPKQVTVVRIGPPLLLGAVLILKPQPPLSEVTRHLGRAVVEHCGALLLIGAARVAHRLLRLLLARGAHGFRVAVPLEVAGRNPGRAAVELLRIGIRCLTAEELGGQLLVAPQFRVSSVLCIWVHQGKLRSRALLALRRLRRRVGVVGAGKDLGSQEVLLHLMGCQSVILRHEGLRHAPEVLLVVAAKHLGGRLVPTLASGNKLRTSAVGRPVKDGRVEASIVAAPCIILARGLRQSHFAPRGASQDNSTGLGK